MVPIYFSTAKEYIKSKLGRKKKEETPKSKNRPGIKSEATINMTFRDVSIMRRAPQELPTPGSWKNIDNPNNKYRPVITDYGLFNAMYLMDSNGIPGWYTSYAEKLIIPVKNWIEILDEKWNTTTK